MNGITKNDLSGNETKLDFEALVKTAAFATRELRQQVSRYDGKLSAALMDNDVTGIHVDAQWLADAARDLAIAADTYAALLGARSREEISIVNKPEVAPE